MTARPAKYQYQASVPAEKFDAVKVTQTDTGRAEVQRPVVVLGDGERGDALIGAAVFQEQAMILKQILCELQRLNDHLNQITEYES